MHFFSVFDCSWGNHLSGPRC